MQRILVPLDGSALAEEVLPYAQDLASRVSGTLFLVRIVPTAQQLTATSFPGVAGMEGVPTMDVNAINKAMTAQVEDARAYLRDKAAALQAQGLRVEWEVRQGTAADEVIKCAQDHHIELIAISSHGRTGLGRLMFGSVADRVIREAGLPVLVIKPRRRDGSHGVVT